MSTIKDHTLYLTGMIPNQSGREDYIIVPISSSQSFSHCNRPGVLVTCFDGTFYFLPSDVFINLTISYIDPLCNILNADSDIIYFDIIEEIPSYFAYEGNSDQGGLF